MRGIIYCMLILSMVSCAPEPQTGGEKGESQSEMARNVPAVYETDACSAQKTIEEKRACGDEQLLLEIDELIRETGIPVSEMTSTKLVVEFTINKKGDPKSTRVINSVHPEVDRAVLNFLSKTEWTPSVFDGNKMKVKRRLPIYIE